MASVLDNRGSIFNIDQSIRTLELNATAAKGDLVNLQSGVLEIAATGEIILGFMLEDGVDGDNVKVNVTPYSRLVLDNDNTGTTFAATHVGARFDITGGTGAQVVDTSTVATAVDGTATGQVSCLEFETAGYEDDASVGLFMVAEQQYI